MCPDSPDQSKSLSDLYESAKRNKDKYQFENPGIEKLACFDKEGSSDQVIRIDCPEFTSLCPVTHQPDFAHIYIAYIPDKLCVESKSLKLYLMAFRDHGDFHEACVNKIYSDIQKLITPRALRVVGAFTPRGGIAIKPISQHIGDGVARNLEATLCAWGADA